MWFSWKSGSLSAKLNESASYRNEWLLSITISDHRQRQQCKFCRSLEMVIGGSDTDGDGSVERGNSLHRSASSFCLGSPLVKSNVSLWITHCAQLVIPRISNLFLIPEILEFFLPEFWKWNIYLMGLCHVFTVFCKRYNYLSWQRMFCIDISKFSDKADAALKSRILVSVQILVW